MHKEGPVVASGLLLVNGGSGGGDHKDRVGPPLPCSRWVLATAVMTVGRAESSCRRPGRSGFADRARGDNILAATCHGVIGSNGVAGNVHAKTSASCCDTEEREEYTSSTKARVPRPLNGSAAQPLTSLVQQAKRPRQHKGVLGTQECCRCCQLGVHPPIFVQAGTKHGTKSGRSACC